MNTVNTLKKNIWWNRVKRLEARFSQKSSDIERALSWHVFGGKRHYQKNVSEALSAHKWCFIAGCNNSGTSLLQSILEKSNQVTTFSFEGQRYTNTLVRAARRGHERVWTEFLDELRLTADDSLGCVPRLVHDWMSVLESPVRDTIVEKTTSNAVRMIWLQKAFPRSYFIGVVRNGYAVTEGIRRKGNKDVARGARHWNLVNRIMLEDAKSINNYLEIRYEDVVANQALVAEKISKFLGLETSSVGNAFGAEYGFKTVAGDEKRRIRNLNKESIKRLSAEDRKIIYAEAAEMLDAFGYTALEEKE